MHPYHKNNFEAWALASNRKNDGSKLSVFYVANFLDFVLHYCIGSEGNRKAMFGTWVLKKDQCLAMVLSVLCQNENFLKRKFLFATPIDTLLQTAVRIEADLFTCLANANKILGLSNAPTTSLAQSTLSFSSSTTASKSEVGRVELERSDQDGDLIKVKSTLQDELERSDQDDEKRDDVMEDDEEGDIYSDDDTLAEGDSLLLEDRSTEEAMEFDRIEEQVGLEKNPKSLESMEGEGEESAEGNAKSTAGGM